MPTWGGWRTSLSIFLLLGSCWESPVDSQLEPWAGLCYSWKLVYWGSPCLERTNHLFWHHLSEENFLGHPQANANFTTFTGTLVLREPFPGDHFFSKCHSLYTGRYPKCLSFLLVYFPFWKGISCFCKISANSVPDRATSFQIEATNEALYCCCFLLVWEHGNVWLLVNFDWTLGKGSCDRKIRSHNSWMVI